MIFTVLVPLKTQSNKKYQNENLSWPNRSPKSAKKKQTTKVPLFPLSQSSPASHIELSYTVCNFKDWSVSILVAKVTSNHLQFEPFRSNCKSKCLCISGLLTATVSSEVFKAAQPALLYLVPFTLLPLLTMAYLKVR